MANATPVPVIVTGAAGKMGREVIKAIAQAEDLRLYAAVDRNPDVLGLDAGELVGIDPVGMAITHELEPILAASAQKNRRLWWWTLPTLGLSIAMSARLLPMVFIPLWVPRA